MNPKLIVIDGKTYSSVNEMPPDIRAQYEEAMQNIKTQKVMDVLGDKNQNGTPDIFENMSAANMTSTSMNIVVNGKTFSGIEDLPPEVRAKYEKAMGALDKNQNGIPDFMEGMMNMPNQTPPVQSPPATINSISSQSFLFDQDKPVPASPITTPDTSNGWMLVLTGAFLLLLCAVGAVSIWYFFLR